MLDPTKNIPVKVNPSILDVAYSEIGETYTGIKDNVTEKLSNYLVACGEAIAPQQNNKDSLSSEVPLVQDPEVSIDPEDVTIGSLETNTDEETQGKSKKKKKNKKKKKKKKK